MAEHEKPTKPGWRRNETLKVVRSEEGWEFWIGGTDVLIIPVDYAQSIAHMILKEESYAD